MLYNNTSKSISIHLQTTQGRAGQRGAFINLGEGCARPWARRYISCFNTGTYLMNLKVMKRTPEQPSHIFQATLSKFLRSGAAENG